MDMGDQPGGSPELSAQGAPHRNILPALNLTQRVVPVTGETSNPVAPRAAPARTSEDNARQTMSVRAGELKDFFKETMGTVRDMGIGFKKNKRRDSAEIRKEVHSMRQSLNRTVPGNGSHFTFNPRSPFFRFWDLLIAVLLVYTACFTPYEVSFMETKIDAAFFINRFVDLCFLMDMGFNFVLPFQNRDGVWVGESRKIAATYLKGWFFIDIVSVFPFELVGMATKSDNANDLKVLRIIRLLRLAKLLRVLRAGRVFQKWESAFSIDYAKIALTQFVVITLAVAHWLACAWHMVIVLEDNQDLYYSRDPPEVLNWLNAYDFSSERASSFSKYIVSLYWSIATLSTLGYGDVVPTTDIERAFVVVCAMLGASVYAYMIGNVCSIVAGMDEHNARFFQMMDALNTFLEEKDLPQSLRRFRRHNTNMHDWQGLLVNMSPQLRQEVSQHLNSKWINKVKCFAGCSDRFLVAISMNLTTETFSAKESVITPGSPARQLYIVERGVVIVGDRIISNGGTIGEDMLFRMKSYVRNYSANTLTNTVCLGLSHSTIAEVLEECPLERKHLRKYVLRMVFRNTISAYVRTHKKIEAHFMRPEGLNSKAVEKDIDFNMLPILFDAKLRTYAPGKMQQVLAATVTLQKHLRRYLMKGALRSLKHEMRRQRYEWTLLAAALEGIRMGEHAPAIKRARITWAMIPNLTPGEIAMSGVPVGDAYRIHAEVTRLIALNEEADHWGKGPSGQRVRRGRAATEGDGRGMTMTARLPGGDGPVTPSASMVKVENGLSRGGGGGGSGGGGGGGKRLMRPGGKA